MRTIRRNIARNAKKYAAKGPVLGTGGTGGSAGGGRLCGALQVVPLPPLRGPAAGDRLADAHAQDVPQINTAQIMKMYP